MTADDLLAAVRQGQAPPAVLLWGEEDWLIQRTVDRLRRADLFQANPDLNLALHWAGQSPAEEVLGAARTLPFLAAKRLIIVHEVGAWSAADKALAQAHRVDVPCGEREGHSGLPGSGAIMGEVARGDIGHQRGAAGHFQFVETRLDPGHEMSVPSALATEKISLSPRPHMFITRRLSAGKLGASLATYASAWDGSSAGMMPSRRVQIWKASSASRSVAAT